MSSLKESVINLIKNMPDNCTVEDIQYELYVKQKIEKGLQDVEQGNIITEEEMDKEINSWHV